MPPPSEPSNLAGLSLDSPWTVHQNNCDEPSNTSYNVQPLIKDRILDHVRASTIADNYDIKTLQSSRR